MLWQVFIAASAEFNHVALVELIKLLHSYAGFPFFLFFFFFLIHIDRYLNKRRI